MTVYPTPEASRPSDAAPGGLVVAVEPYSPAWDVGFEPGCRVVAVDGKPLRDIIDWRWLSADDEMTLSYVDAQGDAGDVDMWREPGQDWGLSFDGAVFDAIKTCRNACVFCFMAQLPDGVRPSLVLRDDDFRLSFLSGTFVTLTNLTPEDETRIVEQAISPLRVSLHASNPDVRRRLMGKHAAHGIAALERLLEAGIEAHCQIVLVPGYNDGEALSETLSWAYAHPGIKDIGIVPLGFTKHQRRFEKSFDDPHSAREVIDTIVPFQERARGERGIPWVFAADEFYVNAYGADTPEHVPPTSDYGSYDMFEDGIGIVRSFLDDFEAACVGEPAETFLQACDGYRRLHEANRPVRYIIGEAMQPFFDALVADSPLAGSFSVLTVRNDYFGGNVDVTGLLTGIDVAAAIRTDRTSYAQSPCPDGPLYLLPRVMFNDEGVTLDDMTLREIARAAEADVRVVSCNPTEYLIEIADMLTSER